MQKLQTEFGGLSKSARFQSVSYAPAPSDQDGFAQISWFLVWRALCFRGNGCFWLNTSFYHVRSDFCSRIRLAP